MTSAGIVPQPAKLGSGDGGGGANLFGLHQAHAGSDHLINGLAAAFRGDGFDRIDHQVNGKVDLAQGEDGIPNAIFGGHTEDHEVAGAERCDDGVKVRVAGH